ncbi:MAG: hypothetical protein LBH18_08105 [Spirochaetaceae bacterium]|jgi:hypothetical protein|nr:hypothetical protein [Spirochaetaceae bacterium]
MDDLSVLFVDTFLFHVLFNNNYDKYIVTLLENDMPKGPCGYTDGVFDVRVKAGNMVIDAGSYNGDFAAHSAARGAFTYAFEPADTTFELLKKTAELNGGKIFPAKKGFGNIDGEIEIDLFNNCVDEIMTV